MTWQLTISPATASKADWISAADVPGAKLLAKTMEGPDPVPLIAIPFPWLLTLTPRFASIAATIRSSRARRDLTGPGREEMVERTVAAGVDLGFEEVDAERYGQGYISIYDI